MHGAGEDRAAVRHGYTFLNTRTGGGGMVANPAAAAAAAGTSGQAPLETAVRNGGSNARTLFTGVVFGLQARRHLLS